MKTINNFLIAGFLISTFACNTNMNDVLSSTDIAALQAMETSYGGAIDANNSLATYIETTGITNDQTCFDLDSAFHQNDSTFEAQHNMYSHMNEGDDHGNDSWTMGMGMNGGTPGGTMGGNGNMGSGSMGSGFNSSICNQGNLELMDSLMEAHEQYHPEG